MEIDKTKQTRKIVEISQKIIPLLDAAYHLLEFDNLAHDDAPKLRIYYQDILCLVTYGDYGTEEYSLNWYLGEGNNAKRAMPQVVNASSDYIASHIMHDAKTFFLVLSRQSIRGRWERY